MNDTLNNRKSILEDIMDHIVDGALPEDYSLPEDASDTMHWVDGAKDGVSMYHTMPKKITMEISSLIDLAVHDASDDRYEECYDFLSKLTREDRTVNIVDEFINFIYQNQNELDPEGLYRTATRILYTSPDPEIIKYALAILELLPTTDEDRMAIRTLGLSDEFTLYTLFNMRYWENGNSDIFDLARKVHGWGRIHAVESLEPETREISNWLLHEGIRNNILPEYSALTVWNKSKATSRLFGRINREDYTAIRDILKALLEEGPVAGISGLESAPIALVQFVRKSYAFPLNEADLAVIEKIRAYAEKNENDQLLQVLDEFDAVPETAGSPDEMIAAKIKSHLPQQRQIAVQTLARWLGARNVPLEELSPKLYAALTLAADLETIEPLRAERTKLLGEES